MKTHFVSFWGAAAALLLGGSSAQAAMLSYYVGVDNRATLSDGRANPNHDRLTFLYAHTYPDTPSSNHYHSKGTYGYDASGAVVQSASNYLPEGAATPRLPLLAGTGAFAGKLVSTVLSGPEYTDEIQVHSSHLTIGTVWSLSGYAAGTPEEILFNSSKYAPDPGLPDALVGRWSSSLADSDVHLVLVSLTPGLSVGSAAGNALFHLPGDELHLGDGNAFEDGDFTPYFWVDDEALPGDYTARFKLTDEGAAGFGDSGEFEFRFIVPAAVPEPGAALLLMAAGAWAGMRRFRMK